MLRRVDVLEHHIECWMHVFLTQNHIDGDNPIFPHYAPDLNIIENWFDLLKYALLPDYTARGCGGSYNSCL